MAGFFSDAAWLSPLLALARLLLGMAAGLLLGSVLEALDWTDRLAKIAAPLAKFSRLGSQSAAAFSLAFFSTSGANGLLSESFDSGKITEKELILSNLFNSFPAFLAHLPGIFLLLWPVLGAAALLYAGLSLGAAFLRLAASTMLSRALLPPVGRAPVEPPAKREPLAWHKALAKARKRFLKRLPKLFYYTIPFYFLIYFLQWLGVFKKLEALLAGAPVLESLVNPEAIGIIVLQLIAEMGATLGAAAALLETGDLGVSEIVAALLLGSALASPLRALRHQLPAYAGFFRPRVALKIIAANQCLRVSSVLAVLALYLAAAR